ncbi:MULTISPECIES: polyprenyl synthetase family protein [unclassified Roseateles]|uniref:polyprenyl synthetase family protein n=1 Tax=unclassified Roseateles TaxID=2626991 RepID=UPI0006F61FDF|nr:MULTISPECIES: polyprenyl synthetase family protein [unclassified Roseateles]KQW42010.1 geranylgeranyl pyrophosphate synthase [Pelomonas sp. Root405]KRA67613.1 geranylgeranyl pyrophosphate synthase [Pelomonas sp. Root662]
MSPADRIEQALRASLASSFQAGHPPRLAAAMQHAVFPGGARIRPQLTIAVAMACGEDDRALTDGVAAAIELLHCASLVHDDLPCFDAAETRRGRPSVHRAFGERLAVLAGDALIVAAFDVLGGSARRHLSRLPLVLRTISQGVGMPMGIVAGQAWECEPQILLSDYQQAKTGALFAAATMAGAQAAGADGAPWRALGEQLGQTYQVADDIRDVLLDASAMGKPGGQDVALGRPSTARALGLEGALAEFHRLVQATLLTVPVCPGSAQFRQLIRQEANRLVPQQLAERVAAVA